MTMQRWEPFADLKRIENRMARLWNRMPPFFGDGNEEWTVPLDIREDDGKLVVEASVPGMKAGEIDVEIEDDVLTIKGATSSEKEEKKKGYLLKERSEGSFYRKVRLPESVDGAMAESTYADGVLTVTMPKRQDSKPKKVTVNVS
ncbi:MAG: Hsp20/alpha crystallin family protein [Chloroflexi bacterium]|nr:Hsp20/alpha crystallin family protein [Chloroflexota bacterium]